MRLVSTFLSVFLVLAVSVSAEEIKPINQAKATKSTLRWAWEKTIEVAVPVVGTLTVAVLLAKKLGIVKPAVVKDGGEVNSGAKPAASTTTTTTTAAETSSPAPVETAASAESLSVSPISETSGTQPPSSPVEASPQGDASATESSN